MSFTDSIVYTKNLLVWGISGAVSQTAAIPTKGYSLLTQAQQLNGWIPDLKQCQGAIDYVARIPREGDTFAYCYGSLINIIPTAMNVVASNPQRLWNALTYLSLTSTPGVTTLCYIYPYNFVKTCLTKQSVVVGNTMINLSVLVMMNIKVNVNVNISEIKD